ncbi:MAG: DUF2029 domain-containing protein [candidate division Zixibacteria bacterium]|nr:DUF2029 domain-containing protein [candidate division Zixibacteria bacterium]
MGNIGVKLIVLALLFLYCLVVVYNVVAKEKQWDFQTFYYAAQAHSEGENPYDVAILSQTAGKEIDLPFVYPPVALYLFRPFALFDYQSAYVLFFILKLAAFTLLILLWRRHFLCDNNYYVVLLLLFVLAFRETTIRDIYAGNVSSFEQLLIWLGFLFFLDRKPFAFAILIVASALFKVTSILFLLLLLLDRDRRSLVALAAVTLAFGGLHLITYLAKPNLFTSFLANVGSLDERGSINPASLALIRDILDAASRWSGHDLCGFDLAIYGFWIGVLVAVGYWVFSRSDLSKQRQSLLYAGLFLYALALPRFKDYSYILLIVPSLFVVQVVLRSIPIKSVAVAVLCISLFPYQPLLLALALYLLILRHIRRESSTAVRG